jgi:hypothetical protein
LKRQFGDLKQALNDPEKKRDLMQKVDQIMENAENHFRKLVEEGRVKINKDGRMTWKTEQTEPTV